MGTDDSPVKMPEMHLIPEGELGIETDVDIKQVLAVLTAYWHEKRVALTASPSGSLFVADAPIGDIFHVLATGANHLYQGPAIACTIVMVMGHPSNGDTIWVRTKKQADTNNSWPIEKKEIISFTITSLDQLRLRIVADTERAIVAYSI